MAKKSDVKKEEEEKESEIVDKTAPPGEVVYQAIFREGEHELKRRPLELGLSGLAAGLSMGFSLMTEGLLRHFLPEATWTPLITKLGYAIGFLIVILGRQQLFTKNTLTVVLPFLKDRTMTRFIQISRLWAIVLVANLVGAFLFAYFLGKSGVFEPEVQEQFRILSSKATAGGFWLILTRGIVAGWLIALMIWLLPFAEMGRIWVIIIIAYVVGLAELPHVVAGNVESFYLLTNAGMTPYACVVGYLLPCLFGNVIGGVALVGLAAHVEYKEVGGN